MAAIDKSTETAIQLDIIKSGQNGFMPLNTAAISSSVAAINPQTIFHIFPCESSILNISAKKGLLVGFLN